MPKFGKKRYKRPNFAVIKYCKLDFKSPNPWGPTLLRGDARYCDMLGAVGSNLKMVKFFMQHLWMLHDVVVI